MPGTGGVWWFFGGSPSSVQGGFCLSFRNPLCFFMLKRWQPSSLLTIEFGVSNHWSWLWPETNSQLFVHAFSHPMMIVGWTFYTG
ncbi:hypothetical protein JHK87_002787 [Glycine soja]|nr:hypothetical protein JHK87_002787 [Glycine soja]